MGDVVEIKSNIEELNDLGIFRGLLDLLRS